MKKGIEQGELTKAREIARWMLAENLPVELVAKLTGLPLADIESLSGNSWQN
jgi:predicted transposase/invertase (TIGR01784 family)